jgi:hypothetical protein
VQWRRMRKWQHFQPVPGVWFEHKGRDEFRCHEQGYVADVYVELQTGTPQYLIDPDSPTKWLPPHDTEVLTQDDRARIVNNLCHTLDYFGRTYGFRR